MHSEKYWCRIAATSLVVYLACAMNLHSAVHAGPYDPPPTYYSSATGTGSMLKSQLHNIIDNHTIRSYNSARSLLQITDQDPNDPDRMILVYDRISLDVSAINPNGSIPGWDNAASWNREHTWPRSRGVDSSGSDNSDLHQLRPSTTQVNSDRGNLNFGGAYGAQGFGAVSDNGSVKWYPGDADAGMIARQQFYMATRYDNLDSATDDLELVNGNPGINGTTMGDLSRLIEWHYAAPPDDFELRRNDVIFDNYQFNRNPFIDRPEYAWSVFVDQQNDSQIAIGGSTPASDGSSMSQVDLGRVIVGASIPTSQSITLNKAGNDGTYYDVTTSGLATSDVVGHYNAFRTGGTDSAVLSVGLDTNTLSAGQRSGSITIDNLDVTTSGGAGRGANDGDDVINLTLDVLDHANPSFAGESDLKLLSYNFGTVMQGSAMPTVSLDLYNLESTADFTADLELDSIASQGNDSVLAIDLQTFGGALSLEAGSSLSFNASLETSTAGTFTAIYSLSFSDEDLPGASVLAPLDLILTGIVEEAAAATADFDADADVDGLDLLSWQRGYLNGATLAEGDANGDMSVDTLDLEVWQQQYSNGQISSSATVVPEPSSFCLLFACIAAYLAMGPTHARQKNRREEAFGWAKI